MSLLLTQRVISNGMAQLDLSLLSVLSALRTDDPNRGAPRRRRELS